MRGAVLGGNGDDTIYLAEGLLTDNVIFGGEGNDTVVNTVAYGDATDPNVDEFFFGGAGDDYIATSHKAGGAAYIYGGSGHDRIV